MKCQECGQRTTDPYGCCQECRDRENIVTTIDDVVVAGPENLFPERKED